MKIKKNKPNRGVYFVREWMFHVAISPSEIDALPLVNYPIPSSLVIGHPSTWNVNEMKYGGGHGIRFELKACRAVNETANGLK